MGALTLHTMAATITPLLPHVAVGIGISNKGLKRPLSNVVFLHPSKTRALIRLVYSVMVERVGEPLKRFAGSFAGMPTLRTPPPIDWHHKRWLFTSQRNHHVTK